MSAMDRRQTKIPRPPISAPVPVPLQTLTENDVNVRKRKGITSPQPKDGPANKRPAASSGPSMAESVWDDFAAEGDTPEDCLNYKLTLKKKDSAATVKEVTLSYIKRLRALGWHLHFQCERVGMDRTALQSAYDTEVQGRADDKAASLSSAATLSSNIASLQAELVEQQEECRRQGAEVQSLTSELDSAQKSEADARHAIQQLEEGAASAAEQIADLQKQVVSANELHQSSTRYCTQLQEYNANLQTDAQATSEQLKGLQEEKSKMSEDISMLRGTVAALETQLAALRMACTAAEAVSARATAETLSLQSELEKVRNERSALADALEVAKKELTGYKEDVVHGFQSERAKASALESRTRAQAEVNTGLAEQLATAKESLLVAEQLAAVRSAECKDLKQRLAKAEDARVASEARVAECELVRRKLHNTILTLKGNIRVFCRVRPLSPGSPNVEAHESGQPVLAFPAAGDSMRVPVELTASNGNKNTFTFDQVFSPTALQEEVFEEVSLLVQSALDGYKVCIFAYGQTGSGKTHTMLGTPDQAGLIPRAVEQVFTAARQLETSQGWAFQMKASMLEIYNEEYKDLLGKGPPAGKKHTVSHDEKSGATSVSHLESVSCGDPAAVKMLLERAARVRVVGATAANDHSSRSHMVFLLSIHGSNAATGQQLNGMLNLIDLAGSERLKVSGASGERLRETQAINKSLSALSDVIAALGSKEAHIPYRNSKLTWLLQSCLGGDAKMLMIANVAPTLAAANETLCSLRFAAKVNATDIGTARRSTSFAK